MCWERFDDKRERRRGVGGCYIVADKMFLEGEKSMDFAGGVRRPILCPANIWPDYGILMMFVVPHILVANPATESG